MLVLLYCFVKEKACNSFYTNIISVLCSSNRRWKFRAMYELWDRWTVVKDSPLRIHECINLSICFATLLKKGHLPLSALKGVSFTKKELTPYAYIW